MNDEDRRLVGFLLGGIVFAFIGFILGHGITATKWEKEAVEKGHAEYYLNEKHEKKWRWKEIK